MVTVSAVLRTAITGESSSVCTVYFMEHLFCCRFFFFTYVRYLVLHSFVLSLLNPTTGCQGCPAWELQTGPMENSMLSVGSQDLTQDDSEEISGKEVKLDSMPAGEVMHNAEALDSLKDLCLQ